MARLQNYNGRYCEQEFEYAFLSYLEAEGWHYLSGNSISRNSKKEVLYADDLEQFLSKTNPDLVAEEIRQIMDNVRLVGAETDFATLHKVYGWMVDGVQFIPQSGLPRMVSLIDFDTWDNNIFRVVNQFSVEYLNNGQKETRRPDILLYVNGTFRYTYDECGEGFCGVEEYRDGSLAYRLDADYYEFFADDEPQEEPFIDKNILPHTGKAIDQAVFMTGYDSEWTIGEIYYREQVDESWGREFKGVVQYIGEPPKVWY